ncbi:bacteriocin BlpK [Streptococcus pneumoniae]|uniref:Bacteriocin BlpK n=1 Tax=Streptococcus pneumoniae TaxID=1313 RepID=A0A4J2CRP4_STREE|nr:bacteriocin BlpK [Streptococcus pneumoniae]VNQ44449.1 bacteriocin BlpK [Streptococcus pneumoniae]
MDTKMMSQFSVMDTEMLACVEGGGCNWGDFAKAGVGGAAVVAALGCAAGVAYGAIDGCATTV